MQVDRYLPGRKRTHLVIGGLYPTPVRPPSSFSSHSPCYSNPLCFSKENQTGPTKQQGGSRVARRMWQTPGIATGSHQGRKENLADDQMGAFSPGRYLSTCIPSSRTRRPNRAAVL